MLKNVMRKKVIQGLNTGSHTVMDILPAASCQLPLHRPATGPTVTRTHVELVSKLKVSLLMCPLLPEHLTSDHPKKASISISSSAGRKIGRAGHASYFSPKGGDDLHL